MKTEREQIEEMQEIIGDCWEFDSVNAELGNGDGYINIEEAAKALVQAGYENVSEYKAEIERLKAENETYCKQINQAYDTGYNDGYDSCQDDIKQAKTDVLNKVKERAVRLAAIETYHICNLIDKIIKEVQDETI